MSSAHDDVMVLARRFGSLRFSDVVRTALYGQHGFYTRGGGAGRRRDFLTSPEVGSLFGAVLARALDAWWIDVGRPDPFVVAECGAGPGALAQAIIRAEPACARALRYLLVESSPSLRDAHRARRIPLVDVTQVLAGYEPRTIDDDEDVPGFDESSPTPRQGPLCASMAAMPAVPVHVVLANELLDNLAFDIVERTKAGWSEIRVARADDAGDETGASEALTYVTVPLPEETTPRFLNLADVADGSRIPVLRDALDWTRDALAAVVSRGRVVVIDYGADTATIAARGMDGWLRTYRGHGEAGDPIDVLGDADITIDVPFDQLLRAFPGASEMSQREFLTRHGIDALVAEAREQWAKGASTGDLASLRARSWVSESEALVDPTGLGAFRVLEWVR